jgi:adenine-specific DNA-methyltransferase
MVYAIQHPFTGEMIYPGIGNCWRYDQSEMFRIFSGWTEYELKDLDDAEERARVCGLSADEVKPGVLGIVLAKPLEEAQADAQAVYERGQWPRFYFTRGGLGGVRRKTYLDSVGGLLPTNFWSYEVAGHTDEAKKEVRAMFDGRVAFDTPKPTRLIERVLKIASKPGDVVLDSFAGSGTTAQAVLNVNKQDRGNRRFILVELGDYADDVTAERVRRTIRGFKDTRVEEHVLFEQKLTLGTLRKGKDVLEEATDVFEQAQGQYTKVARPRIVTDVSGKSGTPFVRVVARQEHDTDVSGTGGAFSFYELGSPLLIDGDLNLEVGLERVREYIWFTETGETYQPESTGVHRDFLGRSTAGVGYFFAFDEHAPTVLDREYLASIPAECASGSYVIYADTCVLSDQELAGHAITFKKIPRDITRL